MWQHFEHGSYAYTDYETGAVRLGVGPIIEQVLLPRVLPEFVAQTGAVQLSILTEHADRLIQYLFQSNFSNRQKAQTQ